jgi:hypothetical protein
MTTSMHRLPVLLLLALPACSGSNSARFTDVDGGGGGNHQGGEDGGDGASNGGGSGGQGAGSGGAPAGTGGSSGPTECSGAPCTNTAGLEACCTESGECGAFYPSLGVTGCIELDQDGRVDPSCPTLFGMATGCCRPTGFCGAFYTRAFGCLDVHALPDMGAQPAECSLYGNSDGDASAMRDGSSSADGG